MDSGKQNFSAPGNVLIKFTAINLSDSLSPSIKLIIEILPLYTYSFYIYII
jgi:hypothetical protein